MWIHKRTDITYEEGFYLFGGVDELNVLHNDLWLMKPNYDDNKLIITRTDCTFTSEPSYRMTLEQIGNFSGQPPCPRM